MEALFAIFSAFGGKPGADFYPNPLPVPASFQGEQIPNRKLSNSNYGLRLSQLKNGWDVSAFYYHSLDASPTFYRVSAPGAPLPGRAIGFWMALEVSVRRLRRRHRNGALENCFGKPGSRI